VSHNTLAYVRRRAHTGSRAWAETLEPNAHEQNYCTTWVVWFVSELIGCGFWHIRVCRCTSIRTLSSLLAT